jgi:hypothetical protein
MYKFLYINQGLTKDIQGILNLFSNKSLTSRKSTVYLKSIQAITPNNKGD